MSPWRGEENRAALLPTAERFAIPFGIELFPLVRRYVSTGCVSTEVDANLSSRSRQIARARQIIDAYKQRDIGSERVLIELASTRDGTAHGHWHRSRTVLLPLQQSSKDK